MADVCYEHVVYEISSNKTQLWSYESTRLTVISAQKYLLESLRAGEVMEDKHLVVAKRALEASLGENASMAWCARQDC